MKVETAQFGLQDVPEAQIFDFPKGIPGFEDHTQFAVIDLPESPFAYLQSLQEAQISLLIADPFIFYPDYEFDLSESVVEEMELNSSLMIRSVVTLQQDTVRSTINLLAPLVFNLDNRSGRQVILHSTEYQSRHPLWVDKAVSTPTDKEGE